MSFVCLLPVILSFLLLAAHFLRTWNLPVVAAILVLPFLLLIRRPWVVRLSQVVLFIGAFEWLRTMLVSYNQRQETGEPWLRMVIILGGVMLFTLLSGLVFAAPRLRRRYGREISEANEASALPGATSEG